MARSPLAERSGRLERLGARELVFLAHIEQGDLVACKQMGAHGGDGETGGHGMETGRPAGNSEYPETKDKARAVIRALEIAQSGL